MMFTYFIFNIFLKLQEIENQKRFNTNDTQHKKNMRGWGKLVFEIIVMAPDI